MRAARHAFRDSGCRPGRRHEEGQLLSPVARRLRSPRPLQADHETLPDYCAGAKPQLASDQYRSVALPEYRPREIAKGQLHPQLTSPG